MVYAHTFTTFIKNLFCLKKPITILLLFVLFFSQIGYRFVYAIQQYQLKEAAKEQLLAAVNTNQFELIDENANRGYLEWEEEGKEFSLHGQMYDVAKIVLVDGKKILYCLSDKKEDQLLYDLAKTVKSGTADNGSGKDSKHTIKFELSDFIAITKNSIIKQSFAIQKYPDYAVAKYTTIKEVNTPPPNTFLYI